MPIKPIFPTNSRRMIPISSKLLDQIKQSSKKNNLTITEAVNYALAERFAPELVEEFDNFKAMHQFSYPNRKTRNRFTRD